MHPKILHLTCKNKFNITDSVWLKCIKNFKAKFINYEIIIYDNNDIYNLVNNYYPSHLNIIKSVINGGALADAFRYLILYLKGGIYADMDCEAIRNIDDLFDNFIYNHAANKNNEITLTQSKNPNYINEFKINPCNKFSINNNKIICKGHKIIHDDWSLIVGNEFSKFYGVKNNSNTWPGLICNWFIIAKPGLGVLKACYFQCIKHFQTGDYLKSVVHHTGPNMFTQMINYYKQNSNLKIIILPPDIFCVGGTIPKTSNSFIKHYFTGSWIKEEDKRKKKEGIIKINYGGFPHK